MVGKILDWIKGNLLIVIFCVLILLMLPASVVASMTWNGKIKAAAETEYSDQSRRISSAATVTYSLPAVFEDESTLSESRAPNQTVTNFYAERRAAREQQVLAVVGDAVERNRGDHEVLMPELLPEQEDVRVRRRLMEDFVRLLVGGENQASVYRRVLESANAGEPFDGDELAQILGEYRQQEQDRLLLGTGGTTLTPEQTASLQEELIERRIALLAQRANDVSVFATPEAILDVSGEAGGISVPPADGSAVSASMRDALRWQWDYWIVSDIVEAISLANSDATGPTGVPDSVVKRIEKILIEDLELAAAASEEDDDFGGSRFGGGQPASRATSSAGELFGPTHTGRSEEVPEGMDVRRVVLRAVVSTSGLPRLIDALGEANFMTVTSVELREIDELEALGDGYYYGPEHVAMAEIGIETIWLREWTKDAMPDEVREALGIPVEVDDEAAESDDPFGDGG